MCWLVRVPARVGVLRASSWGFPSAVGSGQLACCLPVSVDSRRASRLAWICGHASGSCGSGTWHVQSARRPERNLRRAEAGPLHASDPLRCAHSLSLFLSLSVLARACVLACARISSTAAAAACAIDMPPGPCRFKYACPLVQTCPVRPCPAQSRPVLRRPVYASRALLPLCKRSVPRHRFSLARQRCSAVQRSAAQGELLLHGGAGGMTFSPDLSSPLPVSSPAP